MGTCLPGFRKNELNRLRIQGGNFYSVYAYGPVGSGKTRRVKSFILSDQVHNILVLDVEDEYSEVEEINFGLDPKLITFDLLNSLFKTDAQYLSELLKYYRDAKDLEDCQKSLNQTQWVHFERCRSVIDRLLNNGGSLIEQLNVLEKARVVLDREMGHYQLILIIQTLLNQYNDINRTTKFGTLVVMEEAEGLERVDTSYQVPQAIFHGRKRGIVFICIGHRPISIIRNSPWGSTLLSQFGAIFEAEGGEWYRRG